MPNKKQTILKTFLLAIFFLSFFGAAGEARASNIKINADKTLSINGIKTFPVFMYGICHPSYGLGAECNPSRNSEFTFNAYAPDSGPSEDAIASFAPKYAVAGNFWTTRTTNANNDSVFLSNASKNSSSFFGYYQMDEMTGGGVETTAKASAAYNAIKANDPNHPIILNTSGGSGMVARWAPYSDIISWDRYSIKSGTSYPRADAVYDWELRAGTMTFADRLPHSYTKPIYTVIQANGVSIADILVPTKAEARALTYTALSLDIQGVGYWGYQVGGNSGLVNNPSLHAYYKQLAQEIRGLNNVLVLPTQAHGWYKEKDFTSVSINPNPSKSVEGIQIQRFSYLLKKDTATNTWYLFVVNKDSAATNNVQITVAGLSGSMNAKILGLETSGSQRAGRTFTVSNGSFSDSFDGYAAHIYQICSGVCFALPDPVPPPPPPDTEDPVVDITCPGDNSTFTDPVTSVSGTATDNQGVKEVWVKVGPSGAWQPTVLASPNSPSTGWSITNLTGIVSGLNTIYAKVVDASNNDNIPAGGESGEFIKVTLSASSSSAPAPAPSGTVLFDGTFTPGDDTGKRSGSGGGNSWSSKWNAWYCLPQADSIKIVPAPGGRAGYAAKFKIGPTPTYDCGGNQHAQISFNATNIPNPNREIWVGASFMLDPSFPTITGWNVAPIGTLTSKFYNSTGSGGNSGINLQLGPNDNRLIWQVNYLGNNPKGIDTVETVMSGGALQKGVWFDVLEHINFKRDFTGWAELWIRKQGEAGYTRLKRYDNIQTEYPWDSASSNYYMPRIAMYRLKSSNTQIAYILDYKIGTTRASVEYGSSSSSSAPPACTAPATTTTPEPCGNSVKDTGEFCEKATNEGCSPSSSCNESCSSCTPVVVCSPKEGDECKPANSCGETSTGVYQCNGSCSVPPPPLDPGVGILCYSQANECGEKSSALTKCDKSCPADPPALPYNFGKPCQSAENFCNLSSPGTVGCQGCSAETPDLPASLDDHDSCTTDTCDKSGNVFHSNTCGGLVPCGRNGDNPSTSDIDESKPCSLCALFYMLKNIVNYILSLSSIIGSFILIVSGLFYASSAGDTGKITLAKQAATTTVAGLIIIFIAWLAVAAILQALGYAGVGTWNQVICG